MKLLVAGRSNKEIGDALGIEERTVKAHVSQLMRKVGVQNRIALSVHAITHSLLSHASVIQFANCSVLTSANWLPAQPTGYLPLHLLLKSNYPA